MYYLLFGIFYLLSLLPLKVLYLLSDGCCFLLYRVFKYRRQIVLSNLEHAFPEKDDKTIQLIAKQFYHSFCDQWIETLKALSMPLSKIKGRISGNFEMIGKALQKGNGKIIFMLGHQFNWEWGLLVVSFYFKGKYAGIYLPVSSPAIDRLMQYIRKRTGAILFPATHLKKGLVQLGGQESILVIIADQTPGSLKVAEWHSFLNRPAPFLKGPEKVARMQKAAVVFVAFKKRRRGYP